MEKLAAIYQFEDYEAYKNLEKKYAPALDNYGIMDKVVLIGVI